MLNLIPLKAWLGIGAIAVLAFILWHDHHLATRLKAEKADKAAVIVQRDQLKATIETMKVDAALNKETTNDLAKRLAGVLPARPLSVLCRPAVPASTESGAASGADAATERGSAEAPLLDVGSALEAVRIEQQTNNARAVTLQKWERARAH